MGKEKYQTKVKEYQAAHKKEISQQKQQYYQNNRIIIRRKQNERRKQNPEKTLYQEAKRRAKRNNLEFDIEISNVVIPHLCPVLGIPLLSGNRTVREESPSIDRINSTLGYVKNNIRVISYRANRIKGNCSIDELLKVISYMKSNGL